MRRVVTTYSLHRAASGRLTSGVNSSEPDKIRGKVTQIQNTPKNVRDIVVATPGHTLIAGDWAGIEWAIAMLKCEWTERSGYHADMVQAFYENKFDPHRFLAGHAYGVAPAEVSKAQRDVAKAFTHGRTYGGSPRTLARNANLPDAVGITVCAAHDKVFRTARWQEDTLAKVKRLHYVQTPLGWRRYFWAYDPKPTEIYATLVSGTAADLCKVVLGMVFAQLPTGWEVLTSTHDSVMLMVPKAAEQRAKIWLKGLMETPIPWLDGRSWRADIKSGLNWKEVS